MTDSHQRHRLFLMTRTLRTKTKYNPHWQTALVVPKYIYSQKRTSRAEARCDNVIEFASKALMKTSTL